MPRPVSLNDIRPKPSVQMCQVEDPDWVQPQPRDLRPFSSSLQAHRTGRPGLRAPQHSYMLPQAKMGQCVHKVGSEQLSTSPFTGRDDVQDAKRRSSMSDHKLWSLPGAPTPQVAIVPTVATPTSFGVLATVPPTAPNPMTPTTIGSIANPLTDKRTTEVLFSV